MRKLICWIAAGLTWIGMSGCMLVGPDYTEPEMNTPESYKYASVTANADLPEGNWWLVFNDVLLNELIDEALQQNFNLMAGVERVNQARAVARIQQSGLFPFVTAEPSYQKTGVSKTLQTSPGGTFTTYSMPFNVAYELDLFGRVRRSVEAGMAEVEMSLEDLDSIRLLIQTDIAANYFLMRSFDDDIRIVERAIDVRRKQLKIMNNRFRLGVISRLPIAQAEAELKSTEATLFALQRDRVRLENALATLLGKTPSEISLRSDPLSENPPKVPVNLPSELLVLRPDIRKAERLMAAENARVGVATANFYPQITIGANAGYASSGGSNLFDSKSFTWGILPSIRIPLFEGGKNVAELERAKARYSEVYALYRQTVISAFRDVEDALVSVDLLEKQAVANKLAARSAEKAYQLSQKQFEGGLVNYLQVLDTERTYLDTLRLSSQLRGQQYQSAVNLIKALGGTWHKPTSEKSSGAE